MRITSKHTASGPRLLSSAWQKPLPPLLGGMHMAKKCGQTARRWRWHGGIVWGPPVVVCHPGFAKPVRPGTRTGPVSTSKPCLIFLTRNEPAGLTGLPAVFFEPWESASPRAIVKAHGKHNDGVKTAGVMLCQTPSPAPARQSLKTCPCV
jgi:hypothetical protein